LDMNELLFTSWVMRLDGNSQAGSGHWYGGAALSGRACRPSGAADSVKDDEAPVCASR